MGVHKHGLKREGLRGRKEVSLKRGGGGDDRTGGERGTQALTPWGDASRQAAAVGNGPEGGGSIVVNCDNRKKFSPTKVHRGRQPKKRNKGKANGGLKKRRSGPFSTAFGRTQRGGKKAKSIFPSCEEKPLRQAKKRLSKKGGGGGFRTDQVN